jgi:hypothetical protein
MRSALSVASSLFVSINLLASCSESAPVTAPVDTPAPQFDGATHEEAASITTFASGPPANLALAVGFENTALLCTGQDFTISPQRGQAVFTPSGKVQVHDFTREAFVEVFDFAGTGGFLGTDFCDPLGAPVLASGTVTFSQVVHDVPDAAPGTLSIHVTVVGVVDLTSGGQARLQATAQVVLRPDGTFLDKTQITLTPI